MDGEREQCVSDRTSDRGSERLSDIDHVDELARMRGRVRGFACAVAGAISLSREESDALCQLGADVTAAMDACYANFDAERDLRLADDGGAHD